MINLDFVGLFIFIAGFVLGLGAVTVIDIHGFLGRKSEYWTEATIRTHKVTKPLIWLGIFLCIIGGMILYRMESFSGIVLYHSVFAFVLILNGIFLSFYVSPFILEKEKQGRQSELLPRSLQNKIIVSLILSDILWWGSLALLVFYIIGKF
jgi:predicted cobalt transporter CbtA